MPPLKKILAISGSTRKDSVNLNFIKAIQNLSQEVFVIEILEGLSELPHFNPDLDHGNENTPETIITFRNQLKAADGILICSPEYAMGVPGTLKNAIDWTVSSCEFSHKPTALITASSLGEKAHASLLETLKIIEAGITDKTQLLISHAKIKIDSDGNIIDSKTFAQVKSLIEALGNRLNP